MSRSKETTKRRRGLGSGLETLMGFTDTEDENNSDTSEETLENQKKKTSSKAKVSRGKTSGIETGKRKALTKSTGRSGSETKSGASINDSKTEEKDNVEKDLSDQTQDNDNGLTLVDITKVEPAKDQPRKNFNEDKINDLAESIKQHGLIEPLIVSKEDNGFYEIIAGERRWRAARSAGLSQVPVIIKDYNTQEKRVISLIENLQRENLNPIEIAEGYQDLIDKYHLTQDQVAEKMSKSRTNVTNALRLLKLDKRVRQMVIEEKLSNGHARALLQIKDADLQYKIAQEVFDRALSVRDTEKLAKKAAEGKLEADRPKKISNTQEDQVYKSYETRLKESIGTKVEIKNRNNKGKIEINYYNADDFNRIIDILLNK
ncbi:MAG: ParB/RepB/Spo0J family partition protein [Lachnospiraceae bacterium]|nr:ParB/RepB/Spo0J family partition protein [Lachnospiraceae bacterium]MEE3461574.1 ParB/RepB/Spo0J family partition protein [Lachnospiraceae bacterium]